MPVVDVDAWPESREFGSRLLKFLPGDDLARRDLSISRVSIVSPESVSNPTKASLFVHRTHKSLLARPRDPDPAHAIHLPRHAQKTALACSFSRRGREAGCEREGCVGMHEIFAVGVAQRRGIEVPETRRGRNDARDAERASHAQSPGSPRREKTRRRATHTARGPCPALLLARFLLRAHRLLSTCPRTTRIVHPSPRCGQPQRHDQPHVQNRGSCPRHRAARGVLPSRAGTRPVLNPGDVLRVYSARRRLPRARAPPPPFRGHRRERAGMGAWKRRRAQLNLHGYAAGRGVDPMEARAGRKTSMGTNRQAQLGRPEGGRGEERCKAPVRLL